MKSKYVADVILQNGRLTSYPTYRLPPAPPRVANSAICAICNISMCLKFGQILHEPKMHTQKLKTCGTIGSKVITAVCSLPTRKANQKMGNALQGET